MNMSYCRFQNTLTDLRDCSDNIEDELGSSEAKARASLIKLSYNICQDFVDEDGELDLSLIDELPQISAEDEA